MEISSADRLGNWWKVNNDSGQQADFGGFSVVEATFDFFLLFCSWWFFLFLLKPLITLCGLPLTFSLPIFPIVLQLLAFLQGLFTFYHEGYELASEFEPYKRQLQFNLQNVSTNIDFKSSDMKSSLALNLELSV